jgi:hypothetical protein
MVAGKGTVFIPPGSLYHNDIKVWYGPKCARASFKTLISSWYRNNIIAWVPPGLGLKPLYTTCSICNGQQHCKTSVSRFFVCRFRYRRYRVTAFTLRSTAFLRFFPLECLTAPVLDFAKYCLARFSYNFATLFPLCFQLRCRADRGGVRTLRLYLPKLFDLGCLEAAVL